jgi:hypothetical protein
LATALVRRPLPFAQRHRSELARGSSEVGVTASLPSFFRRNPGSVVIHINIS